MFVFIQARSTSTRLPNKVMQEIGDHLIIYHVLARCNIGLPVAVLTPVNDPLAAYLKERKVRVYEGSETDVLSRYYRAASFFEAKAVVRVTSDCPLLDTSMLIAMCNIFAASKADFLTNLPCADGHDIEIMSMKALEWMQANARSDYDREHVTTYIKSNRDKFEAEGFNFVRYKVPYLPEWFPKLSVDTPQDLEKIREIYAKINSEEK